MAQEQCPLCGGTGTVTANDAETIREQIQRLEQRLQEIEGHPATHPHGPTGGYGGDEEGIPDGSQ